MKKILLGLLKFALFGLWVWFVYMYLYNICMSTIDQPLLLLLFAVFMIVMMIHCEDQADEFFEDDDDVSS